MARIVSDGAETLSAPLRLDHLAVVGQNTSWQQLLVVAAKARSPTLSLRSLHWVVQDAFLSSTTTATTLSLRTTTAATTSTISPALVVLVVAATSAIPMIQASSLVVALSVVTVAAALRTALGKSLVQPLGDGTGLETKALGALGLLGLVRGLIDLDAEARGTVGALLLLFLQIGGAKTSSK